jgi:transcriptional regulator with XRE-family HTH domain
MLEELVTQLSQVAAQRKAGGETTAGPEGASILAEIRGHLEMTQIELAEALGVHANSILRWEGGNMPIKKVSWMRNILIPPPEEVTPPECAAVRKLSMIATLAQKRNGQMDPLLELIRVSSESTLQQVLDAYSREVAELCLDDEVSS